jgi:predicted phosphodiesterase
LPEIFKDMLVPTKMQYVLCTGNIGNKETKEWLETLAANKNSAVFVRGDCDEVCFFANSISYLIYLKLRQSKLENLLSD